VEMEILTSMVDSLIFQPPQYNWNIIESGVTHYDPNPLFFN
jgi:hypothetical protein